MTVPRFIAIIVLLGLSLPDSSVACSVCFDATDENRSAFIGTTIFLSLFPLAMIGGGLWWLSRRFAAAGSPSRSIG